MVYIIWFLLCTIKGERYELDIVLQCILGGEESIGTFVWFGLRGWKQGK